MYIEVSYRTKARTELAPHDTISAAFASTIRCWEEQEADNPIEWAEIELMELGESFLLTSLEQAKTIAACLRTFDVDLGADPETTTITNRKEPPIG